LRQLGLVANVDAPVLISGETGTGKEMVAREIHARSKRADQPFVAVNCAALPEGLLEYVLLGHEKGAFSGAIAQKSGNLQLAKGGTLFLDEVNDASAAIQAKLLRVLEVQGKPIGGSRRIELNVRVIAATSRDLSRAVHEGGFREDLYYRLKVVSIRLCPLRERPDDIAALANHFVHKHSPSTAHYVRGVSSPAQELLEKYAWPGNFRELEYVIREATLHSSGDLIVPDDLPDWLLDTSQSDAALRIKDVERELVQRTLLEKVEGNMEAAWMLVISPHHWLWLATALARRRPLHS
jgi:transcriptional regulator with PAS, ATPase and Fis domain